MDEGPLVSIIIPHLFGRDILFRCVESLRVGIRLRPTSINSYDSGAGHAVSLQEILLVDNASRDGSVAAAQAAFPEIVVLAAGKNLGFAGACNWGIRESRGEFLVLLNDDAEVTAGWLEPLLACMRHDEKIAACQPKIRAIQPPDFFDYAGASGGYLDIFGFPFARGRIFQTIERDVGQYDDACDIFWASGACMMLRRTALKRTGMLDTDFFAHMEEIDLCWRLQLAGYRVCVVPASCVHHQSGTTLQPQAPRKVYLNHRNSLSMLLKNHGWASLLWVFPVRLLFDLLACLSYVVQLQMLRALAVLRALAYVFWRLPSILQKRAAVQHLRHLRDRELRQCIYRRSIVIDYFLLRRRRFAELRGLPRTKIIA